MKAFCISDNKDSAMALRLVGVESIVLHEKEEVLLQLDKLIKDKEVAIILLTTKIVNLCPEVINDIKINVKHTLISEIPDRHLDGKIGESIDKCISATIGFNI